MTWEKTRTGYGSSCGRWHLTKRRFGRVSIYVIEDHAFAEPRYAGQAVTLREAKAWAEDYKQRRWQDLHDAIQKGDAR